MAGVDDAHSDLGLYGHLYPGEMDRYADRLNEAAGMTDAAKMRQTAPAASSARKVQHAELGRRWRARRDSNPQPSDP